jgi:transposase-like protein
MDKKKNLLNKAETFQPRPIRYFSNEFKKKIVKELELKKIKIKDVVSLYEVSSTSVYQWLTLFSKHYTKGTKMVLELESESAKSLYLQKRVAELERLFGQKQIEVEFLNKALDLCSEELGYDVKKKYSMTQSNGLE